MHAYKFILEVSEHMFSAAGKPEKGPASCISVHQPRKGADPLSSEWSTYPVWKLGSRLA